MGAAFVLSPPQQPAEAPGQTTNRHLLRNNSGVRALEVMTKTAHPVALVVDDEELLRMSAAGLLGDHGFDVIEDEKAAAALRELEAHPDVWLLFTDIQMPGGSNAWTWREVHARWPNAAKRFAAEGARLFMTGRREKGLGPQRCSRSQGYQRSL
jgi:CheY-like chemotaxis protein